MAGKDNSFEKQMLDFYGIDKIVSILEKKSDGNIIKEQALRQIGFDILMKYDNISKDEMEKEKNKLQIELYNQLEIDRQNGK